MWRKTTLLMLLVTAAAAGRMRADDADFFPLMAWDYVDDEATLTAMANCGVNSVAFVPPQMLDACQRLGIRAIVYDPALAGDRWDAPLDADRAIQALPELLSRVNAHPAVWGYHLKDEPSSDMFPALGRVADELRRLAPGKWPYINLLPGEGPDYDTYLRQFVETCRPPIISYDRYVLFESGPQWPVFWANLAQVREAAQTFDLPFHNIVLTAAHWHYRVPTDEDIRMQVFGSIVYGAKGIAYYKFMSESLACLQAPDLGNFRDGPLDAFRCQTPLWGHLRTTNRVVHNLAPHLRKLRSDAVYHFGDPPPRNSGPPERSLVRTFRRSDGSGSGFGSGTGFVVGDFTHEDGSRWVMIVNKVPGRSIMCCPEFRHPIGSLEYVDPVQGSLRPYPDGLYALAPGQGVLLKLGLP